MEYLLDTDICVFLLRGRFSLNRKIDRVGIERCFISEITILELIYGAKSSKNLRKHLTEVDKLKALFEILPIEDAFYAFAEEKVRLKKSGELIPDFDLLIGTTALSRSMKMVTNNVKHLQRIEGIEIENWTDPAFNEFIDPDTDNI